MAVTINARGTSVPYFKIGKSGTTFYQGDADPSSTYTINANDVWFDTTNNTIKFRVSNAWSGITTASDLTVTGDLIVQGTTTTVNSTEIQVQNTLKFEGSTSNDYETTLTVVDPTQDNTVTIPNTTDTLVAKNTTDTLTNKTINLANNTLSGTLTEFNTAFTANITDNTTLQNVGLGDSTFTGSVTGIKATAIGRHALQSLTSGNWNSGLGYGALYANTDGYSNTAVGVGALGFNISGDENTAIGVDAGLDITGSGNVLIGHQAGKTQTAISNKLIIANSTTNNLITGDFATNEVTINGDATINSTGAIVMPVGTTAQRPGTGVVGMMRFNSDIDAFEGYNGASWVKLGGMTPSNDSRDNGLITDTEVFNANYGSITDTDTASYTLDRGLVSSSDTV
jgi:hypothetical protein